MEKAELIARYPWYEKHENAIHTIVAFSGAELEQVLATYDKKLAEIIFEPLASYENVVLQAQGI